MVLATGIFLGRHRIALASTAPELLTTLDVNDASVAESVVGEASRLVDDD